MLHHLYYIALNKKGDQIERVRMTTTSSALVVTLAMLLHLINCRFIIIIIIIK